MKKKVLTFIIIAVMIVNMIPIVSCATSKEITSETLVAYDISANGLEDGDTLIINTTDPVILTGSKNISIVCGVAGVNLTLSDVSIDVNVEGSTGLTDIEGDCALSFRGEGNTLSLLGTNILISGGYNAGIKVDDTTSLTISGTGILEVTAEGIGAGIGANGSSDVDNDGNSGGEITILSGTVTVIGGFLGAGIGGCGAISLDGENYTLCENGGSGGNVTISGGTVTATGGQMAAGIGGGVGNNGGSGGNIIISSGTVTATGGMFGSGMGGGAGYLEIGGSGGNITISGGTVISTGGLFGSGIGGSMGNITGGSGGNITISAGTVTAIGSYGSAGIGGGNGYSESTSTTGGSGGTINISGGTVIAASADGGAGIGGGLGVTGGSGGMITISGGTVTAKSSYPYDDDGSVSVDYSSGAGIGGGAGYDEDEVIPGGSGGIINISGGFVFAQSEESSTHDIGAGSRGSEGSLTITGNAEVFLANDNSLTPNETYHKHEPGILLSINNDDLIGVGTAYGFVSPEDFEIDATGGYFVQFEGIPTRITGINDSDTASVLVNIPYTLDLSTIFEDSNGDTLSYEVNINNGGYKDATESYAYTPTEVGSTILVFRADDGTSYSSDTYTITLTATNAIPSLKSGVLATDTAITKVNKSYTLDLSTIFEDLNEDSLTYEVSVNGNSYISADEDYSYIPTNTSAVLFKFRANDGIAYSDDTYTVILTVNSSTTNTIPSLKNGLLENDTANVTVNTAYTLDLSTIFEDADGDSLTYEVNVDSAGYNSANESFSYTPTTTGATILVFKANDGTDDSTDTYTVSLTATSTSTTNIIPSLKSGLSSTDTASVTVNTAYTLDLSTIFEDADGDSLTYEVNVNSAGYISGDEDYTYTPTSTSAVMFEFRAKDNTETSVDTYTVILTVKAKSTNNSSSSSTTTDSANSILISSSDKGKDTTINITKDKVTVKLNGKIFSGFEDSKVELLIQKVNSSYFNLNAEGEWLEDVLVYDLSILIDDVKTPLRSDSPIEIEIEVDSELEAHKIVMVYINTNGEIERLDGIFNGETIKFTTNHFSYYGVMYIDKSFDDIIGHWAQEAIEALASRGITEGTSETAFSPDATITRAEFVTLVVRYFDLEAFATDEGYIDIENNLWYTESVLTARELGILPAVYGNEFKPEQSITREDMMYILYEAIVVSSKESMLEDKGYKLEDFSDVQTISDYAQNSAAYLVSRDIIHGSDGIIYPKETATRAEVAQMIYNLIKIFYE
jgi:hypothetical protein